MRKVIINITSSSHNKDFRIWGLDEEKKRGRLPEGESDRQILVIRGTALKPNINIDTYDSDCEEFEDGTYELSLKPFEEAIRKTTEDAEKVGVLCHPDLEGEPDLEGLNDGINQLLGGSNLSFKKGYGTTDEIFYDRFYKSLAYGLNTEEEGWEDDFDNIWAYCMEELTLGAKLDLLNKLLMPSSVITMIGEESDDSQELKEWEKFMQIAESDSGETEEDMQKYEEAWGKFKSDFEQYADDPSGEGYYDEEGPLTKLRDKLLAATP